MPKVVGNLQIERHRNEIFIGMNLIVCYFTLGNKEKMKSAYHSLLTARKALYATVFGDEEQENAEEKDEQVQLDLRDQFVKTLSFFCNCCSQIEISRALHYYGLQTDCTNN
jgi:hypothetical protein